MENPLWENRRLGGDLKSNYTNNLTMNNFKRPPPPSSPLQFLDLPQQPNTTYNKSDLIEKGVKQLSKDLGEFVKPYKPKFVDPNQSIPCPPCRGKTIENNPWMMSKYEEMKRREAEEFKPIRPIETPVYPLIPTDDTEDIFDALETFHNLRIQDYEQNRFSSHLQDY